MKRAVPLKPPSQREDDPRCTGRARYAIDGKKLCRRHASMLALSILLSGCNTPLMRAYSECRASIGEPPASVVLLPSIGLTADPGGRSWADRLAACEREKLAVVPR